MRSSTLQNATGPFWNSRSGIATLISTLGNVTDLLEKDANQHLITGDLVDALTQLQYALDRRFDKIDVISNRLLYLCIALGAKIEKGHLTYNEAVTQWLDRACIRQLMSRTALMYMLADHIKRSL